MAGWLAGWLAEFYYFYMDRRGAPFLWATHCEANSAAEVYVHHRSDCFGSYYSKSEHERGYKFSAMRLPPWLFVAM